MFITKEQLDAEHTYRIDTLRSSYRSANSNTGTNPRRRTAMAAAAVAMMFAGLSVLTSSKEVDASKPPTESWIAANWESVEPTWEPNYVLLEEILQGYKRAAVTKEWTPLDGEGFPR